MSYSSWKRTAFPTRKDTDLNLVMRGVMELITKPCLGQWMFCVIWLSLCLSIHLSSSSIHPNHHPIAITTISNTAVSSVRPAAAASPQEGLARERGCHAKHILWRHRILWFSKILLKIEHYVPVILDESLAFIQMGRKHFQHSWQPTKSWRH